MVTDQLLSVNFVTQFNILRQRRHYFDLSNTYKIRLENVLLHHFYLVKSTSVNNAATSLNFFYILDALYY